DVERVGDHGELGALGAGVQVGPDGQRAVGPVRGGGRPGPAASAAPTYEGFDPGDEPLDEVIDERTARQSSEEQAVQLLREAFGAEKIDEVDAR
ncbi:hypothetical protein ABT344_30905, partial [Micromonospora carbonacea]|uniref:hypothetical protein n=1 Tax=Micromonospora carbonacea TaxID=47853 RepID=UPI003327E04F